MDLVARLLASKGMRIGRRACADVANRLCGITASQDKRWWKPDASDAGGRG